MDPFDRNELFGLLGQPLHLNLRVGLGPESETLSLDSAVIAAADRAVGDMPTENQGAADQAIPSTMGGPGGGTPAPKAVTVRVATPPHSIRNEAAHIRYLLNKAVPRLSRYALEHGQQLTVRQRRDKLRKLLVWLFEKEGYTVTTCAPAPYRLAAREIAGRIDLTVANKEGKVLLALETDWTREAASILKLAHWAAQQVPVVWILGASVSVDQLVGWRRFADEVGGHATRRWLQILHLEHGWVRDWEPS